MKRLSGLFLSLIVIVCGCATAPDNVVKTGVRPAWMDNPNAKYPFRYYLTAVGEGDNLKDAQSVAIGNLAKMFRSEIKVEEHLHERCVELMGDKSSYQEKTQFNRDVNVSSGISLINVKYADSYMDNLGRIYSLAYINRYQTAKIYVSRLEKNDARIVSYVKKSKHVAPAVAYAALSAAVAISTESQILMEQLNVISTADKKALKVSYARDDLLQALAEAAGGLRFSVDVAGDQSGKVSGSLENLVTGMGFVISNPPSLKIKAKVLLNETDLKRDDLSFVRYEVKIDVMDISGQVVVSVTKQGREGHVSKAEAEARCVRTITSVIENELKTKLQAYFDGLVK